MDGSGVVPEVLVDLKNVWKQVPLSVCLARMKCEQGF